MAGLAGQPSRRARSQPSGQVRVPMRLARSLFVLSGANWSASRQPPAPDQTWRRDSARAAKRAPMRSVSGPNELKLAAAMLAWLAKPARIKSHKWDHPFGRMRASAAFDTIGRPPA